MKIQNIKINNFGKLNNKQINFSNNINIVYGNNESGKSTLLKFIQAMFYGLSKNKNGKEISDLEKYAPWEGESFSGKLKYELNNKEQYEIYRDFRKKESKIFNKELEDISEQFNIDKTKGNQFFYNQTNINEELFLSTIVAEQQNLKLDEKSQTTLVQKLSNVASTGEENTSYEKIINKLNKKQLEEIGTKRSQDRPINIIQNKLEELQNEREKLEEYQNKRYEIEKEIEQSKAEIREKELELRTIQHIKEMQNENKIETQKIVINKKEIENCNYKIEVLNERLQEIEKINQAENNTRNSAINSTKDNTRNDTRSNTMNSAKKGKSNNIETITKKDADEIEAKKLHKNNNAKASIIIIVIGIILSIIAIVLLPNKILKVIPALCTIIYGIVIYYIQKSSKKCITKKKEQEEIQNKQSKIEKEKIEVEIKILEENKQEQEQQISIIQSTIKNKEEIEKQIIKNSIENLELQKELIEQISSNNIESKTIYLQGQINEKKVKAHKLEIEYENILEKLEKIVQIEEEISNLESRNKELKEYDEAIEITKQEIQKAYLEMKKNITPKFTKQLSQAIQEISKNKYENVKFNNESGIIVEIENGNYINANKLSIGTIEQLYLSLRLSTIEEISNETMPIILDEAFAYFDETRLENTIKYLSQKFKNRQIIIFTCTNREKEILEKNMIEYTQIEL